MKKTGFLFPGQGSQKVGMAQDLFEEFDFVRELFDMAEEITRIKLKQLCFQGPFEELTRTVNLQPAVTVVNLAWLAALSRENINADWVAGHSLGEYSALCAAGVISAEDCLKLVCRRGVLMHREATRHQGAMQAVVGLPLASVEAVVAQVRDQGVVSVANHNAEHQVVITGTPQAVEQAAARLVEKGAKAIPLKVSGAWHSELIRGAEADFTSFLSTIAFDRPRRSLILNVTAETATDPAAIKAIMARQLFQPVRWYDCMRKLIAAEVEIVAEVGPGKVLTGLLKKTLPADAVCQTFNVNSMRTFEKFHRQLT